MPPIPLQRIRRGIGWLGLAVAVPVIAWLPLGLLPFVPSPIDVFGVLGLRTPAAAAVAGLVLAAIGFHET